MRTVDKSKFINKIIEYIVSNNIGNYSDVIKYILSNKFLSTYVSKMKNRASYVENLKYDNQFKETLRKYNLYVDRNRIKERSSKKSTIKNEIQKDIQNITLADVIKYNNPYTQTISKITNDKRRLSKINSYTNERTLNYILDKYFDSVKQFSEIIDNIKNDIKLTLITSNQNFVEYKLFINDKIICEFTVHFSRYIKVKFLDDSIKPVILKIKKIYPFTHFEYFDVSCLLYLLYVSNYNREVKFLLFEVFNTISNYYRNKFVFSTSNSYLYNLLNQEFINKNIYNDTEFIITLIDIFDKIDVRCCEFLVAIYKLIVYEKNKLKRYYKDINNHMSYIKRTTLRNLPIEYLDFCVQNKYNKGNINVNY